MVRCDMAGTNQKNVSYVSNHCNVYDVRLQKEILMDTKTNINNKMMSLTLLLLLLLKKIGTARPGEGD